MDTVYQPREDSFLMLDAMYGALQKMKAARTAAPKTEDRGPLTVLDMGTGSGILAIAAAKSGCSVTAADINPEAIKAAGEAAEKAGVKINLALSDLFENVKGKFDLIIFNPPYVRTADLETQDAQSIAWQGGPEGMRVIDRFQSWVYGFLKPGGKVLLLVSSIADKPPKFPGFRSRIVKKESLFFERLWVLELTKT